MTPPPPGLVYINPPSPHRVLAAAEPCRNTPVFSPSIAPKQSSSFLYRYHARVPASRAAFPKHLFLNFFPSRPRKYVGLLWQKCLPLGLVHAPPPLCHPFPLSTTPTYTIQFLPHSLFCAIVPSCQGSPRFPGLTQNSFFYGATTFFPFSHFIRFSVSPFSCLSHKPE